MVLPLYLAMTAAETYAAEKLPEHPAWMACHFSSYSTGLSNLPKEIPPDSMLILNDRIPVWNHDPKQIQDQLSERIDSLSVNAILLDFQRPNQPQAKKIAEHLCQTLSCPVGVSELYAAELNCPVFVSAAPPHLSLQAHLCPWKSREIWLEAALQACCYRVDAQGCTQTDCSPTHTEFYDDSLHCGYSYHVTETVAEFVLVRQHPHLLRYLEQAQQMGVTKAIGLYQELATFITEAPSDHETSDNNCTNISVQSCISSTGMYSNRP